MKEVNEKSVRERILQIEHDRHDIDGGISIREEFELACLRKLLPTMTTNSPNPVDVDFQALIADCQAEIAQIEKALTTWGDVWIPSLQSKLNRQKVALAALKAEAVAILDVQNSREEDKFAMVYTRVGHALVDDTYTLYTTPPAHLLRQVELPDISAGRYYTEEGVFMAFDYKRDLKAAIRAAGVEVKND